MIWSLATSLILFPDHLPFLAHLSTLLQQHDSLLFLEHIEHTPTLGPVSLAAPSIWTALLLDTTWLTSSLLSGFCLNIIFS